MVKTKNNKKQKEFKKFEEKENKEAVIEAGAEMEKQMARQAKHTTKVKSPEQERREEKYMAY